MALICRSPMWKPSAARGRRAKFSEEFTHRCQRPKGAGREDATRPQMPHGATPNHRRNLIPPFPVSPSGGKRMGMRTRGPAARQCATRRGKPIGQPDAGQMPFTGDRGSPHARRSTAPAALTRGLKCRSDPTPATSQQRPTPPPAAPMPTQPAPPQTGPANEKCLNTEQQV